MKVSELLNIIRLPLQRDRVILCLSFSNDGDTLETALKDKKKNTFVTWFQTAKQEMWSFLILRIEEEMIGSFKDYDAESL